MQATAGHRNRGLPIPREEPLLARRRGGPTGPGGSVLADLSGLYVFLLAAIVGFHIIHRVPPLLHTPLMSATNAVSAISVVGAIVVAGSGHDAVSTVLGVIAVAAAMTNVVGGFLITDRMLKMFKADPRGPAKAKAEGGAP
jgi:H+-translocating NAD(P) transhydrogenase subunit alpha